MRWSQVSPLRCIIILFQKNKTSLPTDYGHHFPTYMKIKKQGTLLHTYDTVCRFSHRTCTSFIQIHLGILTALIFCMGLFLLHMLMWGSVLSGGSKMKWGQFNFLCNIILEKRECSLCGCSQSVSKSVSLSVCQSVCQSVSLSVCLSHRQHQFRFSVSYITMIKTLTERFIA